MDKLLDLPTDTLIVFGAGYLAYRTAYDGLRSRHKPLDVTFISIAFGLVAKLVLISLAGAPIYNFASAGIAVASTLLVAAVWRLYFKHLWGKLLRFAHVSYSDGMGTAWDKVRTDTKTYTTQLFVKSKGGDVMLCEDLSNFIEHPFGPCQYGEDGSISMYVTAIKLSGESKFSDKNPNAPDEHWGSKITYIPADQIAEISVRSKKR